MSKHRIAVIPGDGIGKEVIPAGQEVMQALAKACGTFAFEFENFGWGGDWYRAHGEMMPQDGLDALRNMYAQTPILALEPEYYRRSDAWFRR
jgi:tartrate dehydrogenase/decarboxylase/D-malate dehydrogenase